MEAVIFCLPYAGGSRLSFKRIEKRNSDLKFITIEYIAHKDRFTDNNDDVIRKCCDTIIKFDVKEYYILGYSMGGIIGYEVIKELERRVQALPLGLIVISCNSPDIGVPKLLDDNELDYNSQIVSMGGVPKILQDDSEMLGFFVNMIKYDLQILFKILNKSNMKSINTDIMFFHGVNDNIIESNSHSNWKKFTKCSYYFKLLDDGHFINENSEKIIINKIKKHYKIKRGSKYEQNTNILF